MRDVSEPKIESPVHMFPRRENTYWSEDDEMVARGTMIMYFKNNDGA